MIIQHNMLAMNAQRQYNITGKRKSNHTEKLSSGYRINRAADDAAGLAISEKMRRQIRGLMQGTANAQDGISYVQTAEGAMSEVHEMLQRMNELTIQSLNGTLSDSDREYLDSEFTQLRTEIDRINQTTKFNDQPVFEEHENSYYSIIGNKRWNLSQAHTILPSPLNEMNIHLPDGYDPKDYTLTVPAGTYTMRELIDEIDTALENLKPSNPGFVFEYTKENRCKLTFEGGSMINSVDGPLSYLFFDSAQGMSSSDILGTSKFPLEIVSSKNDILGFYVEGREEPITIKIDPGKYSRSEMIKRINDQLPADLKAVGVKAEEYGESSIKISSGNNVSITGLKGNMFKWENVKLEDVYDSAFYDNVGYGQSGGTQAYIEGEAHYYEYTPYKTDTIHLTDGNNNVLRVKIDGASDYTEIKFPEKTNGYTIDEIAKEINEQLNGNAAVASTGMDGPHYGSRLILKSLSKGSGSTLEFDRTPGSVFEATYNALFCDTRYLPTQKSGANQKASITGYATMKNPITLTDDNLLFNVDNKTYKIEGIVGTYAKLDDLLGKINTFIQGNFADISGKIEFAESSKGSGRIAIKAIDNTIKRIDFDNLKSQDPNDPSYNPNYKKLFTITSTSESIKYPPKTDTRVQGAVVKTQGGGLPVTKNHATSSIEISDTLKPIKVGNTYNTFYFDVFGTTKSVSVPKGNYNNIKDMVSALNSTLKNSSDALIKRVNASYNDASKELVLSIEPTWDDNYQGSHVVNETDSNGNPIQVVTRNFSISIDRWSSNIWGSIWGTTSSESMSNPSPVEGRADPHTLTTHNAVDIPVEINDKNNELKLKCGSIEKSITLTNGSYTTAEQLKNELQNKVGSDITVTVTDGKLQFSVDSAIKDSGVISGSGSFYDNVLISKVHQNNVNSVKGTYPSTAFTQAFIVGRKDLTEGPIDIAKNINDEFIFNFTHPGKKEPEEFKITIPPGTYVGNEIASYLQEEMKKKFENNAEENLRNLEISVSVGGGINTGVANNIDKNALQIVVNRKPGSEPAAGSYIIDGIRGSAAGFIFYKTTAAPTPTYITGSKRLYEPIQFTSANNVLTMNIDGKPYEYTFPTDKKYTANEFNNLLKDMFKDAPISASLENGYLKLSHRVVGKHTITDIGGSARSYLFLEEEGRSYNSRSPLRLQVGDESRDGMYIPRMRIGSASLAIHSIFISKPKYAEKALRRISDAINMVGSKRGTYGVIQNRLEHLIANNNNIIENTTAAESRIRDTDMAKETVGLSLSNILAQAGASVLAQANQRNQSVMKLLE